MTSGERAARTYDATWSVLRGYIAGAPLQAPPYYVRRKLRGGGWAEADLERGAVGLSRSAWKSLGSRFRHRREFAQYVLAHEWAHIFSYDKSEGAAEAFARLVMRRVYGVRPGRFWGQSYSNAARAYLAQHGAQHVLRGQFRPSSATLSA